MLNFEYALRLARKKNESPNRSFLMYFLGNRLGLSEIVEKYEPQVDSKTEPGVMICV